MNNNNSNSSPKIRVVHDTFYADASWSWLSRACAYRSAWRIACSYSASHVLRRAYRELMRDAALAAVQEARRVARTDAQRFAAA